MVPAGSRAWLVALFVAILALPILGVSVYLAYGMQQAIAFARAEQTGLRQLSALGAFFSDASSFAHAVACGEARLPVAAAARVRAGDDLAAIDALAVDSPTWSASRTAWKRLPPIPSETDFDLVFDPLAATLVNVSDGSNLTFDPEHPGIDLSDAMAYRIPEALVELQSANRALCAIRAAPTLAQRLDLRRNQVLAQKSIAYALQDVHDAIGLEGPKLDVRELNSSIESVERDAPAAYDALQSFMSTTSDRPATKPTAAALSSAVASLDRLMRAEVPVFSQILDLRIQDYQRQRLLRILPGIIDLLAALLVGFLVLRLISEHAALQVAEQAAAEQERMALHDSLTGVMNRRAFYAALQRAVTGGANHGAICIFDVDHFKGINDTYGHLAGDDVLTHLAQTIEASVRSTDAVARIGGDEFAVFMHPPVDRRGIERVLAKITTDVRAPVQIGSQTVRCSVSVGAALIAGNSMEEVNQALALADAALYTAKSSGRGSYAFSEG